MAAVQLTEMEAALEATGGDAMTVTEAYHCKMALVDTWPVMDRCDHLVLCKSCAAVTTTCPVKGCSQILDPGAGRSVCIPSVRD